MKVKKYLVLFFALAAMVIASTFAQEAKNALLIANGEYGRDIGTLSQPVQEAVELKAALESVGFKVTLVKNADLKGMRSAIKTFKNKTQSEGGIAFFHYGGHAIQVKGVNYLIPLRATLEDEEDASYNCLNMDNLMESMRGSSNIVVLDSCRNDPFPKSNHRGGATRGLAAIERKPVNSIIVYSAEAGNTAQDGIFTPILTKHITEKNRTFSDVLISVRKEVLNATNGKQKTGEYRQLTDPIYVEGFDGTAAQPAALTLSEKKAVVTVEQTSGKLEISTNTPCTVYSNNVQITVLKSFETKVITLNTGMQDITLKYHDGKIETTKLLINKESTNRIETGQECYKLAENYIFGKNGFTKDEKEALKWFRKAADGGHIRAMDMIGQFYEMGWFGLDKNKKEAQRWYQKAQDAMRHED